MAATLKADTLQNASSATANLTLDTSGNVTGGGTIADSTAVIRPLVVSASIDATHGGLNDLTNIDFTGIPSWVKRINVSFLGVSGDSTNPLLVQIGTGGTPATSGYLSTSSAITGNNICGNVNSTAGFMTGSSAAANVVSGIMTIFNISGNKWVSSFAGKASTANNIYAGGDVSLSGTLDIVRITFNSTEKFDAGTVNISYE